MTSNTKTGTGTPGLARSRYRADNHRDLKRYLSPPPPRDQSTPGALPYTPL